MSNLACMCAFCYAKIKEVVILDDKWDWRKSAKENFKQKIKLKKEGKNYGIWEIWWTICTTKLKRKIR